MDGNIALQALINNRISETVYLAFLKLEEKRLDSLAVKKKKKRSNPLTKAMESDLWRDLIGECFFGKCMQCKARSINPISVRFHTKVPHADQEILVSQGNILLACKSCSASMPHTRLSSSKNKGRALVWLMVNGYSFDAKCYCCRSMLFNYYGGWQAGHVLSNALNGSSQVDNLRSICSACNSTMATTNMDVFIWQNGYKEVRHPGDVLFSTRVAHEMYENCLTEMASHDTEPDRG